MNILQRKKRQVLDETFNKRFDILILTPPQNTSKHLVLILRKYGIYHDSLFIDDKQKQHRKRKIEANRMRKNGLPVPSPTGAEMEDEEGTFSRTLILKIKRRRFFYFFGFDETFFYSLDCKAHNLNF